MYHLGHPLALSAQLNAKLPSGESPAWDHPTHDELTQAHGRGGYVNIPARRMGPFPVFATEIGAKLSRSPAPLTMGVTSTVAPSVPVNLTTTLPVRYPT